MYNISVSDVIAQHISKRSDVVGDACLIAPDKGAEEQVRAVASHLDLGMLVFTKERIGIDQTKVVGKTGEC